MVWLGAPIQMLAKRRTEEQLLILEEITGMESLGMLWKYSNNHCAHQKEQYFWMKMDEIS